MGHGVCKLTKFPGKFINSHIIPAALTRSDVKGEPFIAGGNGRRPVRQFSSWTDRTLVTQAGEDILTALDTAAIDILRQQRMVWSGWGNLNELPQHETEQSTFETIDRELGMGFRTIKGVDFHKLRLFLLSLLWRAAASERTEFSDITLPEEHLERLRCMILNGDSTPRTLYPIILTQVSTRGDNHNLTPILWTWTSYDETGSPVHTYRAYRFYLDGLIALFVDGTFTDEQLAKWFGKSAVGNSDELGFATITFDKSFQRNNLYQGMYETAQRWPNDYAKLTGDSDAPQSKVPRPQHNYELDFSPFDKRCGNGEHAAHNSRIYRFIGQFVSWLNGLAGNCRHTRQTHRCWRSFLTCASCIERILCVQHVRTARHAMTDKA